MNQLETYFNKPRENIIALQLNTKKNILKIYLKSGQTIEIKSSDVKRAYKQITQSLD